MHTYEMTVYTQKACRPCKFTKRTLDQSGIHYTEKDATNLENHRYIAGQLGHMKAPVVTVHRDGQLWVHWSDLRPDILEDVIGTIKANEEAAA